MQTGRWSGRRVLHGLTESQELSVLASVQYAAIRDGEDVPSAWRDPNVLPKDHKLMRIETNLGSHAAFGGSARAPIARS
jgi:hypothetical protein